MLMILNSAFEILGITSIIPIISITIKNDLSLFEGMFFFDYLKEFSEKENFILLSFIFVGLIFILKNLYIGFYNYFLSKFQCETTERISNNVYSHYLNLDYKNHLNLSTSKLIYNSTEAIEIFRGNLLNLSNFLLEIIVLALIISFLIFLNLFDNHYNDNFGLSIIFFYFFVRQNFFWGMQVKNSSKNRINILNTSLSSIKDIKIYSGENFFNKKFKIFNFLLNKYQKIYIFFLSVPKPFFEAFIVIILLSSLYYFLRVINISYEIIILNLAIFAVSMFRIYPSIYRIAGCFQKSSFGKSVLDELTEILKKDNLANNFITRTTFPQNKKITSLDLKDISFKYTNKSFETLKKVNLNFKKNQFVGIKGETGVGKSTLVDIFLVF